MSFQQRRGVKLTMLDSNGRMKGVMQRSVAYAICPYVHMSICPTRSRQRLPALR